MEEGSAMKASYLLAAVCGAAVLAATAAFGDVLELKNGTVLTNCYVRDEGTHFVVWESAAQVGSTNYRIIPRSQVAEKGDNPHIDRPEAWDAHPNLPDLSVTYIEMNPKLAGLHGRVQYEGLSNAPWIGGAPVLDKRVAELEAEGKSKFLNPEYIVQNLKLKYTPGEQITFTAHVKNVGFAQAQPFQYRWLIDDKEVARGVCDAALKEMEETTFEHKWAWQDGLHTIGFEVAAVQAEIATINNKATDPMWGWGYFFLVDRGRVEAWHRNRTAYGTFSWEDYYRWHVTIMDQLFAASVYPSAPDGIKARVRLDRIVYTDDVTPDIIAKATVADDGISYHQGGWIWSNSDEENTTGVFADPERQWRNETEWSLPHELGHQLGLVDYYAIDYAGDDAHVWPDNGEKVCHLYTHPIIMMAWHGPHLYSEVSAMYFNQTWDKPRGYFGDHYFAMPAESVLEIADINDCGVPGAKVEIFQRAVKVDPQAKPHVEEDGVTWYPIVQEQDGFWGSELSTEPVIVGTTDKDGLMRLPNRDVQIEVRTLNGYHRTANPFGDINVVGNRGLMLVKVTKDGNVGWYWLQAVDFNLACYTGHKDRYTIVLRTPYGSVNSPKPPVNVKWEYVEPAPAGPTRDPARPFVYAAVPGPSNYVRVMWEPAKAQEQSYIDRPIGYRIYRRIGTMGLNDRPWFPVGTVEPGTHEFIVDLQATRLHDVDFYSDTQRFAVTTVAGTGVESGLEQGENVTPKQ
jgi:hypothetical protein